MSFTVPTISGRDLERIHHQLLILMGLAPRRPSFRRRMGRASWERRDMKKAAAR